MEQEVVEDNGSQSNCGEETRVVVVGCQDPDDVECHFADDDTVRRLLANDPAVAGLEAHLDDDNSRDDFNEDKDGNCEDVWCLILASAIGRSQHLRSLKIIDDTIKDDVPNNLFFELLAENRSIEHLSLDGFFNNARMDIFRILASFVKHNLNLRSIEISVHGLSGLSNFSSVLQQSKMIRLEKIGILWSIKNDASATDFIHALNSMPGLCYLSDLNLKYNSIGTRGCKALGELLANSATRLQSLQLSGNHLDDQCMKDLTNGLMSNKTIKELDLSNHLDRVSVGGWQAFSAYLSNPNCSIEKLDLSRNSIGDEGAIFLGNSIMINKPLKLKCLNLSQTNINDEGAVAVVSALSRNKHFKSLHMGNKSISSAGWIQCFRLMSTSDIVLEELHFDAWSCNPHLHGNNVDDEAATILFKLLVANTALKSLTLANSELITSAGWTQCFRLLLDSKSSLETLNLDGNAIDDDGAGVLVKLLAENYSVSTLSLQGHRDSISLDGWLAFTRLLHPSSSSKLKVLRLGATSHYSWDVDDYVIAFAEALAGNTTLEVLTLFDCFNDDDELYDYEMDMYNPPISIDVWDIFAKVLCDNSSIASVCTSNHTLHEIWEFHCESGERVPNNIKALLSMNCKKNKAEVVRTKIINFYFTIASNVERTFMDFATVLMPNAIGWIGNDCLGLPTMYRLLRSMPWLLDAKITSDMTVAMEPPSKFRKVE